MVIRLPDHQGHFSRYSLVGAPIETADFLRDFNRVVFSAAHVVADPRTAGGPSGPANIDWQATMAIRRHLQSLGLGIAEAIDTAQRGMGLDWKGALDRLPAPRPKSPMRGSSMAHAPTIQIRPAPDPWTMCAVAILNRSWPFGRLAGAPY